MGKKIFLSIIITAVVVGAGAFYGGTLYEKSALASQGMLRGSGQRGGGPGGPGGQGQGQGRQFGMRGQNGGNVDFAAGQVTAKDDKSVTVKARDGSTKIIFFSDSTTVGKAVQGSKSDLNVGQQIVANGKNNPDGSLSAQNIQIRPDQPQNQPQGQ